MRSSVHGLVLTSSSLSPRAARRSPRMRWLCATSNTTSAETTAWVRLWKNSRWRNVMQPLTTLWFYYASTYQMSAVMHNTLRHKCIFINRAFWGRVALLYHQSQRHRCGQGARPRWPHRLAAWKEEIWGLCCCWVSKKGYSLQLYIFILCVPLLWFDCDRRHWWLRRSASKTSRDMTYRKLGWLISIT